MVNRFSKLKLRAGRVLRNRVVVPPMASATADEFGFVTAKTLEHYARLAEAESGLLFAEYSFVDVSGKSEDNQLGVSADQQITGLAQLAAVMKSRGAVAGIQLTHSGGKSDLKLTAGQLMGPSGIAVPVKDRQLEVPKIMNREDIELWKRSFADAVDRAVLAGFDVVEFHAAHGDGLNQWPSPITNQRQDEYGVTLIGRMKMLFDIVVAARKIHPALVLSVRMPGQDFFAGGLSVDDSIQVAKLLAQAGVDILNISSGIGGWRRPSTRVGQGYLVDEAAGIQAAVKVPVIGVGGIESGDYIDQALAEGRFALAAIGRAILSGPAEWAGRNLVATI